MNPVELSFVIPVYNGALSIASVVEDIARRFAEISYEVVLVNDGSADKSAMVCAQLVEQHKGRLTFVDLAKNFGEHNAVLCGLRFATGAFVAILDDDGQNPPAEVWKLYLACKQEGFDVVYGRYMEKRHHWFRNLGSKINDRAANLMLQKPKEIYLASFKVMSRFMVDEICKYKGAFPYIDGIIFRSTQRIHQVVVEHQPRGVGSSNYTLKKLVTLWLNMFINHSIWPLRMASLLGFATAIVGIFLILLVVVEKLVASRYPLGMPFMLVLMIFFSGLQLTILGLLGEYLGRLFLDHNGQPQSVVRSVLR